MVSALAGSGSTPAKTGAPARVAVNPRGIGRPDVVGGPVDRVQVHCRLPGGHLGSEFGVGLDRGVGNLVDEVGTPIPLIAGRVDRIEGALQRG